MIKLNKIKYVVLLLVLFSSTVTPVVVSAQILQPVNPNTVRALAGLCVLAPNPKLGDLMNYVTCVISKSVIPLIFALAMAMFIWGVVQYVINNDEEAKKAKGKQFMIWGIIALTVMVGVWGLVRIVGTTFGIQYAIPQVNTTQRSP